jgi:hypothetical protein
MMATQSSRDNPMKNVGFFGGSSLFELGPVADVQLFFDCISSFVIPKYPLLDWTLLTDRLYRRYLALVELEPAQLLMDHVQETFNVTASDNVNWGNITDSLSVTRLNYQNPLLVDIFSKYFEAFSHCRESAEIFLSTFNQYQPLKIVVSDMPSFYKDKNRPVQDYDTLEGDPFWKR